MGFFESYFPLQASNLYRSPLSGQIIHPGRQWQCVLYLIHLKWLWTFKMSPFNCGVEIAQNSYNDCNYSCLVSASNLLDTSQTFSLLPRTPLPGIIIPGVGGDWERLGMDISERLNNLLKVTQLNGSELNMQAHASSIPQWGSDSRISELGRTLITSSLFFFFFLLLILYWSIGGQTSQSWRKSVLNIHWKD